MNDFCRNLRHSLTDKFEVDVDVYVSKKKKLVHISFVKPLISYVFFGDIVKFKRSYWQKRNNFFFGIYFYLSETESEFKIAF